MNGWNEFSMKQEQYRDQLREAEGHRLVKLVADDCHEAAFGQAIRKLVSGVTGRQPSGGRVRCGEHNLMLEKSA